jgi:hypothetical protein
MLAFVATGWWMGKNMGERREGDNSVKGMMERKRRGFGIPCWAKIRVENELC